MISSLANGVSLSVGIAIAIVIVVAIAVVALVLRNRHAHTTPAYWAFALFPLMQAVLLLLGYWTVTRYCAGNPHLLYVCIMLALLCVAADAVVMLSVVRVRKRARDEARARRLRTQLDEYLEEYQVTVENIESTARMRHDLRNQVQIVNALAQRGEFDLAQHHIAAMLKELQE